MGIEVHLELVGHQFQQQHQAVQLFEQVSLQMKPGTSCAIIGASGSGKSTLLGIMAALEAPARGRVRFIRQADGAELKPEQFRRQCGFVFQQFHLLHEFSALHNVALPLRLRGDRQALKTAASWLEKVGLAARADMPVRLLSGGEQQRVAIARALISKPAVVFADEPTGNLDEQTAAEVADLMFRCCAETGASLVLVTHNAELAQRADTTYLLAQGRLGVQL